MFQWRARASLPHAYPVHTRRTRRASPSTCHAPPQPSACGRAPALGAASSEVQRGASRAHPPCRPWYVPRKVANSRSPRTLGARGHDSHHPLVRRALSARHTTTRSQAAIRDRRNFKFTVLVSAKGPRTSDPCRSRPRIQDVRLAMRMGHEPDQLS